ncbi:MAG: hypothetical protein CL961_01780 [Euryarchaeota archaeon]|nr:hypothetical protein [Euryarchaeota archaeon]
MVNIIQTFTYKIPDDYTEQTSVNDSSASFTYRGPQFLELHVNKDGSVGGAKEADAEMYAMQNENGDIVISAHDHPLEAAVLWGSLAMDSSDQDSAAFPHKTINLPDGGDDHVFKYPWPPFPWKAYEASSLTWNSSTKSFGSMDWHQPWTNWGNIGAQANGIVERANEAIAEVDAKESPSDSDTAYKAAWVAYKTEAENKVQAYMNAGLKPHEVSWTHSPDWQPAVIPEDSA